MVDTTINKRATGGGSFVDLTIGKRWDGAAWVDILAPVGAPPTVDAGADATLDTPTDTFARTATESAGGSTITGRSWSILSGPMGTGTQIGGAAALSWVAGSSPEGTLDIRQPVCQEMAFEITSTSENGTTDWTTAYSYIEDIGDKRGYTAGLVGVTSATGDMLVLVQNYSAVKPGNTLESYLPGLETCASIGYGDSASSAAATNLGTAFMTAWQNAANTDPIFRKCQRELRKSLYWDDALTQALADGVGPLGLALHYDILINHGVGSDPESYGGILAAARASSSQPPSQGGTEAAYLTKLCDLRDAVLQNWGDYQVDGRSGIYRALIAEGNFGLIAPINWSVYGDAYSLPARPTPPDDARIGIYTLRYTATSALGSGSDDVTVTVNSPDAPVVDTSLFEYFFDDFDDNSINTAKWPNNYGPPTPTEVGGRARIPCGTDYAAFESAYTHKISGSSVYARIYAPAKSTGTDVYVAMSLQNQVAPEGTNISISINVGTGTIRFNSNVGYWDNNAVQATYNASTHAWVRIREAAGTLYWDTSADGLTWTQRRSLATPAWIADVANLSVKVEAHRDAGVVDYAEVDNLNVAP